MRNYTFRGIIVFVTLIIFVNLIINDIFLIVRLDNLSKTTLLQYHMRNTSDIYSRIKDVRVKNTDNTYTNILFPRLKVIKIVKILDRYSEDNREQYILLVEPVK